MSDEAEKSPPPSQRRAPRGATALFDRIHMQGVLGSLKKVRAQGEQRRALSWFEPWLPKPEADAAQD